MLLFVDYGQLPAAGERRAARSLAAAMGHPLEERVAPLTAFGAGSLVGEAQRSGIPPEFWPFRNQMLITLAAMAFSHCDPLEILIGTVASDAVHPDGTAGFIEAMSAVLGAQGRVSVRAPAIGISGDELLARAALPDELLGWTFSCHTGEWACGQCRGCNKHNAMKEATQEKQGDFDWITIPLTTDKDFRKPNGGEDCTYSEVSGE